MPFVIPFFLKVILGIFLFQLALLWLALPFAIYGIKKRMQLAREQRDDLLQELFWLRKTVETIPGASGVARRHSQKFMQDLAEKQKDAAVDGSEEVEGKQDPKPSKTAGKSGSDVKTSTVKKPAKKIAAKKAAEVNRDNEPQITVPRPAASLVDGEEYGEEEEDPEEDYPDIAFEGEAAPKKKAKKKAAIDDDEADDSDDIEDDSLDYMDDDSDASHMLVGLPTKSSAKEKAQAMTNMVVEIPEEDEINEDEEGFFVYRGEKYEHLLDAMKQQQDDAQKKVKAKAKAS